MVSSVSKEVNSGYWGVNQRTKLSKVCGEGELADWPKVAELWRYGAQDAPAGRTVGRALGGREIHIAAQRRTAPPEAQPPSSFLSSVADTK